MTLDTTIGIDVVVAILTIIGFVWRLDTKIERKDSELRKELKALEERLRADNENLRAEFKADNAALRAELKDDISGARTELRADNRELRADIRTLDSKVDDINLRLARLEGKMESRDLHVDAALEESALA